MVDKIKQGDQVCIVSDDSFHPEMKIGTAAWVITSSSDHRHHFIGYNSTLGASETQCFHRSELSGLVGGLSHWIRIGKKNDLLGTPTACKIDGLEAVKDAKRHNHAPLLDMAHFDLV